MNENLTQSDKDLLEEMDKAIDLLNECLRVAASLGVEVEAGFVEDDDGNYSVRRIRVQMELVKVIGKLI